MIKLLFLPVLVFIFSGCNNDAKVQQNFDGKELLKTKCASCHDINMPPIVNNKELAPPMMAVSFHVYSFVTPSDESQRTTKAIEFVVDYVQDPALEKSFCDKDSLKRYGLMPSQKENLSVDETKAIAIYMFEHFTQENLSNKMKVQAKYDALPAGKKVALKYKCLGCHKVDKKIIGPSFQNIAKKFKDSKDEIQKSIKNGSKAKWESSNGAIMPPFKQIDNKELELLSAWILKSNS